ncbi:cell envelope integrity protein CreD [Sphingomonas daechungensis]|uniref:Cell envelope integrity protein CreD n=1 Tax=Sphingomonas daechungensis TaxID=1176646 RepID=A0ABX6T2W7_9SPHN|nr:cell envelope integrity protein CreD [Sphingomonas daechungensis]QNP43816.1 cell envelope integrity protein CreD [Sphingomonas daechungensis]
MYRSDGERTPGAKLLLAILVAAALSIPLFSIYLLNYDRQTQSETATKAITEGWGGPQAFSGPLLVIPYKSTTTETVVENGKSVTRTHEGVRELTLSPEVSELTTSLAPEHRKKSIYETVVYDAKIEGAARFGLPRDLSRQGVDPAALDLARAELRFGISDPRGIGANPKVSVNRVPLQLQPGGGSSGGSGFFAPFNAGQLIVGPIGVRYKFGLRGNSSLTFAPKAGQTVWNVRSPWPHPSFGSDYLPVSRNVRSNGFDAVYEIGNLALGESLVSTAEGSSHVVDRLNHDQAMQDRGVDNSQSAPKVASISLVQPIDLYSQVDRATKYGFLFIGFTFLALLMFDIIGGVRVSAVEYLLMGAALVLFFVLLLAFAEVIGFSLAYVVASAAIAGLNTAYSAAVLKSWGRASFIGGLLVGLYAVLYVLLSLEAFALLIGSLLLFAALAGVMYGTRKIDWSTPRKSEAAA